MAGPDLALSAYLRLAVISHQKGQWLPRNKFLVLSGNAACHTGLLDVAESCRDLVIANNKAHMIGRYESFPAALKAADFQTYLKQLSKFCSVERAEHLLSGLGETVTPATRDSAALLVATME